MHFKKRMNMEFRLTNCKVMIAFMFVALLFVSSFPVSEIWEKAHEEVVVYETVEAPVYNLPEVRSTGPQVMLSEIMFNPPGMDAGNEWVAIYNNGSETQDLTGWTISNRDGEADVLLPAWELPADSILYVHFGWPDAPRDDDFPDHIGHYYTNGEFEILNNTADGVALYNAMPRNDTIVDYMGWKLTTETDFIGGPAGMWAHQQGLWLSGNLVTKTSFTEGAALGRSRFDPYYDSAMDWELGKLLINEIRFNTALENESVEVYNPTAATVDSQGWCVRAGGMNYGFGGLQVQPYSFVVFNFYPEATRAQDVILETNETEMKDGQAMLFFNVGSEVMSNSADVGLYSGTKLVDYVAWGAAPSGQIKDDAVAAGIWSEGQFVDGAFEADDSIGRDQFSTDTNLPSDFSVSGGAFSNGPTLGINNLYKLLIWDADLSAPAGEEWVQISNYGGDVNLDGWQIYNRSGSHMITFTDLVLPDSATLTIHFGVGDDELDFSDLQGDIYLVQSGGTPPTEKFFDDGLDIILLTTGDIESDTVVAYELWLQGGFVNRRDEAWYETAWGWLKSGAQWLADKVADGIEVLRDGCARLSNWLARKVNAMKSWVRNLVYSKLTQFDIGIGDYITLSLAIKALGWTFTAEANADVEVPLPSFPVVKFFLEAHGSITIDKDCSGITKSGKITIRVGIKFGQSIKKIFKLELTASVKLIIDVGDIDIQDVPSGHFGTVTSGVRITIKLILTADMSIIKPKWHFVHYEKKITLAQFDWTKTRNYENCRAPRIVPVVPPDYDNPNGPTGEGYPPYYCPGNVCTSTDIAVTNGDDISHDYDSTVTFDDQRYGLYPESGNMLPGTIGPGYTQVGWVEIVGPPTSDVPSKFYPEVTIPEDVPDGETFGGPGNEISVNFTIGNEVENINGVNMTIFMNATDNSTLNDTITMFVGAETINMTCWTDNGWPLYLINENGAQPLLNGPGVWQTRAPRNSEPRTFTVVIKIPENATLGSLETVHFGTTSALPNFTGLEKHTKNVSQKIRIAGEVIDTIWEDDLETDPTGAGWTAGGEWEWGIRDYKPAFGPASDDPGPNVYSIVKGGNSTMGVESYLETPHFDLRNYTLINLRFWDYLRAVTGTWSNKVVVYANSSGVWYELKEWQDSERFMSEWQYEYFDVTPYKSEDVSFIFYYKQQFSGTVDGWHIDNVSLVAKGPMGEVVLEDVLGIQDGQMFDTAQKTFTLQLNNTGLIPLPAMNVGLRPTYTSPKKIYFEDFEFASWSTSDDGNGAIWNRDTDVSFQGDHSLNIGGATLRPTRNYDNNENDVATSPVIDLMVGEKPAPVLTFWENSWIESGADVCELYFSTDGGTTWTSQPVWSESDNDQGSWEMVEIPLDYYLSSQFVMKFVFISGVEGSNPYMAIDNVMIETPGESVHPYATAVCPALDVGETADVDVTWTPMFPGDYDLKFYVNCTLDRNRTNNVIERSGTFAPTATVDFITPAPGNVTGFVDITVQTEDQKALGVDFYIKEATRADMTWTKIGSTRAKAKDGNWKFQWDTFGLSGDHMLLAEVVSGWGSTYAKTTNVFVQEQKGTLDANFTFTEVSGGKFQMTDASTATPAQGSLYSIVGWYWTFGDGADTVVQNPAHVYSAEDDFSVTLTVIGSDGAKASKTQVVSAKPVSLTPEFNWTPVTPTDLEEVVFVDNTDLQGLDPLDLSWAWDFGDGETGTGKNATHTFADDGNYTVGLTISQGPISWTTEKTIEVLNVGPITSFLYEITNLSVSFTDNTTDEDGSIISWHWSFGDGTNSTQQNPIKNYSEAGVYNVELTVSDDDGVQGYTNRFVTVGDVSFGSIKGTVTYSDENLLNKRALITATHEDETEYQATAAPDGSYELTGLKMGVYTVKATAEGYNKIENVDFLVDGDMTLDFNMVKSTMVLQNVTITVKDGELVEFAFTDDTGKEEIWVKVRGNGTVVARRMSASAMSSMLDDLPEGLVYLGVAVEIELETVGTVEVELQYDDEDVPDNVDEESISIYSHDGGSEGWSKEDNSTIDPTNNRVKTTVNHLTVFAAMGEEEKEDEGGLPTGAIVGIVVFVVILLIVIVAVFFVMKRKEEESDEDEDDLDEFEDEDEDEEIVDEDEVEVDDGLDDMDRKELKAFIKENELDIKVKKSMDEGDIREAIREQMPEDLEDEDTEDEDTGDEDDMDEGSEDEGSEDEGSEDEFIDEDEGSEDIEDEQEVVGESVDEDVDDDEDVEVEDDEEVEEEESESEEDDEESDDGSEEEDPEDDQDED